MNIWQAASESNADQRPSKTKILKKAISMNPLEVTKTTSDYQDDIFLSPTSNVNNNKNLTKKEYYMQDPDIPKESIFYFTKKEATFLRLAECIRKYVLEYESGGDTLKCLWPWYRNSFHQNDKLLPEMFK